MYVGGGRGGWVCQSQNELVVGFRAVCVVLYCMADIHTHTHTHIQHLRNDSTFHNTLLPPTIIPLLFFFSFLFLCHQSIFTSIIYLCFYIICESNFKMCLTFCLFNFQFCIFLVTPFFNSLHLLKRK